MLKIAIVGCGKIAEAHALQIDRIAGCEIVAACDREPLMAQQLYGRFPVKSYFSELTEMLCEAKPDVVHICTPPESHYDIATTCLKSGAHVYVEKPFTLDEEQARKVITLAIERGLRVIIAIKLHVRATPVHSSAIRDIGFASCRVNCCTTLLATVWPGSRSLWLPSRLR